MLHRLKSLPLTILLTILIWMYAEAQFTSTQPEVPISVRIASGSTDYALRTMDPVDKRYTNLLNFVVTLRGPRYQIDQIFQDSQGLHGTGENKLAGLTFIPTSDQLRAAISEGGGELHPHVLQMLNGLEYFRSRGVTVTFAAPGGVTINVEAMTRVHKTVVFHSPIAVERAALDPDAVDVLIPTETLRAFGEDKLVIRAVPQNDQQMATLPPNTDKVIPVRFVADYPGAQDERVRVLPSQGNATVRLQRAQPSTLAVTALPIWISGPPVVLAKYDVEVTPKAVNITLSGSLTQVEGLRQRLANGGTQAAGIHAYLDLTPDDHPGPDAAVRRNLRYVYPEGLTLMQSPPDVGFKLSEKASGTNSTPPTPP